jgi:hypothetical protein
MDACNSTIDKEITQTHHGIKECLEPEVGEVTLKSNFDIA